LKNVNQTQILLGYEHISSARFLKIKKNWKNWKIGNKENRKTDFIFWNFKDEKKYLKKSSSI